jgi:NSS family neurotransmitter:Na+ symporter
VGAAAGFGNVWKFPYLVSQNGGGIFLLAYVLCLLAVGMPLMVAEIMLGRRSRRSPANGMALLADEEGRWRFWQVAGWMGLAAAILLLSCLSVVSGWAMAYVFRAASGMFADLDVLQAAEAFQDLIKDPERLLAWHTVFIAVTMMIVGRGVRWGLEEAIRWFMPMLIGLLLLLAGYAATTGYFGQALIQLFMPDFERAGLHTLFQALLHSFFTLSLGIGAVMAYGSYLDDQVPVIRSVAVIVSLDTFLAVLAGLVVLPVALANDLAPASGPELVFQTLPLAFGQMPHGTWFGTLFFLLLVFAAWTSAIALLEVPVAHLVEFRGMERELATSYTGILVWVLGLGALLSFNVWEHVRPLAGVEGFRYSTIFDVLNFISAGVLLPIAGFLFAVFGGWCVSTSSSRLELGATGWVYRCWLLLIRYVTPLLLVVVFLQTTGLLEGLWRL